MAEPSSAASADPVLQARRVFKSYGRGAAAVHVLKELDFTLRAGEFAVLLGPSGSGKSTLLNLLGLMDQPDSGDILLNGAPTRRLGAEGRAGLRNRSLGFVFQFDSLLPEFTILENILMPRRIALSRGLGQAGGWEEALKRAHDIMGEFGLQRLSRRFPSQVSGGERQRAALCRALINDPAVILADEPTGNLDKDNAELVFKDLKHLSRNRGVAVLMATHNEEARRYGTRIQHLRQGAMAEDRENESLP